MNINASKVQTVLDWLAQRTSSKALPLAALGATGVALYPKEAEAMYVGPKAKGWENLGGKFSSLMDKMERAEISDAGAKIVGGIPERYKNTIPLDRLIRHDELFNAYPELRKVDVINADNNSFIKNDVGGRISMDFDRMSPRDRTPVLLHEIQHAIQEKEGWARGGTPGGMDELLAPEKNAIKTRMKEIRELTGLGGPFWGSHGELARAMYESEEAVENVFKKYPILKEEIKLREALDSLHGNYSYPRLAGEIEARDTAARMGLSATQRQMTPPYSGQGIPLKDIITKMGVAAPVGAVLAEELAKRRGMERQWEGGGLEPAYGLEDIAAAAATGGSSLGAKSAAVAADIGINAAFEKVLDWLNSRSR